jgi:uncharacterized protein
MDILWGILTVALLVLCVVYYGRLFFKTYLAKEGKVQTDHFNVVDIFFTAVLVAYFIYTTVAGLDASEKTAGKEHPHIIAGIVVTLVQWLAIIGIILLSYRRRHVDAITVFGFNQGKIRSAIASAVRLLILALPIVAGGSLLWTAILKMYHYNAGPEQIVQTFVNADGLKEKIPMMLFAILIAPAAEEFVFRGYIYATLRRYCGPLASLIFSSVVFALIHTSVSALLPLFLLGLFFAIAYEKTGNLAVPMMMHGLFNAINIVALLDPRLQI